MRSIVPLLAVSISACATTAAQDAKFVEVSGRVLKQTHPDVEGQMHQAFVIELDHPVDFQGHRYTEAMIDDYNDHILFASARAVSSRVATKCSFSTVTPWVQATLLCTPDEIRIAP